MSLGLIFKLFHVLAAFALVGGDIGRTFALQRAKQSKDVKVVSEMMQVFMFATTKVVSPAGALVFLLGLITAWLEGWPILGSLQGGQVNWVFTALLLNLLIIVLVIVVLAPRGKIIGQAIGAAMGKGEVTSELTAALNDKVLNYGLRSEFALIGLIIILMVLKPF